MFKLEVLLENTDLKFNDLYDFINLVSDDFNPPFLSYVDLKQYYDKVVKYGNIVLCKIDNQIVGLLFFYCNDLVERQAYASFLAVSPLYRKTGIAKKLMISAINYSKKSGMKTIRLRTNNGIALNMYQDIGYSIINKIYEDEIGLVRYYLAKEL